MQFNGQETKCRSASPAATSARAPQDWKSGERREVVEIVAPFGEAEEMVKDLELSQSRQ